MPSFGEIVRHYGNATTFVEWQKEENVRRRMWENRLAIVKLFASGGHLLDVGTGDGHFLEVAAGTFVTASTEISSRAIELAGRRGFHPAKGAVEEVDFGDSRFDVITLWHVLEHLPRPSTALDRLRQLLAPGGVGIIAVPNEVRRLPGRRLEREASRQLTAGDEIHLYFWTPGSFRTFLGLKGWKVDWLGVDDVHVVRNPWTVAKFRFNVLLARLAGWHFDPAMIAVCRPSD